MKENHFHLGQYNPHLGKCEGTDKVLLAYLDGERAFLIDILPHGQWTELPVLKKLKAVAPDIFERVEMRGVNGLARVVSPKERKKLMENDIISSIKIDGKVYLPPNIGTATSGLSFNLVRFLDAIDKKCEEYLAQFNPLQSNYPRLKMAFDEPNIVIIDEINQETFGWNIAYMTF